MTETSVMTSQVQSINIMVWMTKLWHFLTRPSELLAQQDQRRARLLAALLIPIILLGSLGGLIVPLALNQGLDQTNLIVSIGILTMSFAYGLSRSRYYIAGAFLMLLTFEMSAVAVAATDPAQAERMFAYVVMAGLLASMLLPATIALGVLGINLAMSAGFVILVPAVTGDPAAGLVIYQGFMGVLITIFTLIRGYDLRQIEQQTEDLAEAVLEAREADRVKSQFLATMSHELRTPLNAIIGFAEVMLMGLAGEMTEQAKHTTERIVHNSQRLLQLIDDLLDLSKIEAGRFDVVRERFEPAVFLANIQKTLEPHADQKQVTLNVELVPAVPRHIIGDVKRLEQVALNLGSNAIKFTDSGEVTIQVDLDGKDRWQIVVEDTGIGIPLYAQDFIFEKFRQLDGTSRRAYGGSGLGLAITKELVTLMEGSIRVESQVGQGSRFTASFPLARGE